MEARAGRDFTMIRQPLAPVVRRPVDSFRTGGYDRVPPLEGDIGDLEVFVDADKFRQTLGNGIANACKYSPPDRPLAVRLVSATGELGVRVQDRGEDMDEARKRRIFERFCRAESTARVAGTGLGMSIVKAVMDIHGGRIGIASAPGEGTAVTLWLPLAAPRVDAPGRRPYDARPGDCHGGSRRFLRDDQP